MTEKHSSSRKLPAWMVQIHENTSTSEKPTQNNINLVTEPNEVPNLKFLGIIQYYNSIADCNTACENLIKQAESRNEMVLGFDMEWPVDFRTGSGKTALIQICPEEQTCYLFHVGCMETLPEALIQLLKHPKVKLVGLNIRNDLWKLSRDFQIIVKPIIESRVIDLSEFANKILNSGQTWSLGRLTLHLLKMRINKDDTVRKSNWNNQKLSKIQQGYAATDAYVSLLLHNHLKMKCEGLNKKKSNSSSKHK